MLTLSFTFFSVFLIFQHHFCLSLNQIRVCGCQFRLVGFSPVILICNLWTSHLLSALSLSHLVVSTPMLTPQRSHKVSSCIERSTNGKYKGNAKQYHISHLKWVGDKLLIRLYNLGCSCLLINQSDMMFPPSCIYPASELIRVQWQHHLSQDTFQ